MSDYYCTCRGLAWFKTSNYKIIDLIARDIIYKSRIIRKQTRKKCRKKSSLDEKEFEVSRLLFFTRVHTLYKTHPACLIYLREKEESERLYYVEEFVCLSVVDRLFNAYFRRKTLLITHIHYTQTRTRQGAGLETSSSMEEKKRKDQTI